MHYNLWTVTSFRFGIRRSLFFCFSSPFFQRSSSLSSQILCIFKVNKTFSSWLALSTLSFFLSVLSLKNVFNRVDLISYFMFKFFYPRRLIIRVLYFLIEPPFKRIDLTPPLL